MKRGEVVVDGMKLKRCIVLSIPDSLVVRFNAVMRARGFRNAKSYVLHLIMRDIEECISRNPKLELRIRELEKKYAQTRTNNHNNIL